METEQKLLQTLLTSPAAVKPKALLLMPSNSSSNPNIDLLKLIRQQMPIILVDRYIWGFDSHYVGLDNQNVGRSAFQKLSCNGHKTLAFVGGFSVISPVIDRMSGFLSAARMRGCPLDEKYVFFDSNLDLGFVADIQQQINKIGEKLLKLTPMPTGIFCSSDRIAAALTNFFLANGIAVPGDVSLIGCDNDIDLSLSCPLPVSSFSHPFAEIADTLYALSNNLQNSSPDNCYHTEFSPHFIPGKTWK